MSRLYLIPMVISELANETIPEQVKEVIADVDIFLVENIRTARRFISSLKLGLVIEELDFHLLDKNTAEVDIQRVLGQLKTNSNIGVLSESGCPGIADPGAVAVAWAHKNDVQVVPLVGPSSIILGLMASGFNGQKFCFHGYLPIDKKLLIKELKTLEAISQKVNQTQIFIETPYRNNQLLKTIIETCNGNTKLCVAKGLNGNEEEIKTLSVNQWKETDIELHKVPTVFLIYADR